MTASADLLERERELGELGEALKSARTGAGRLVVIQGEAGVGKSRLLAAAAGQARESGMRVRAARGLEFERDFPFGVAIQLFEPALAAARPDQRASLLAVAAAAATLFSKAEVTGLAEGADRSYALVHGLSRLAAGLAAPPDGPLLLTVDDAQWADPMSLRFLIRLAADVGTLPVAVVLAVREGDHDNDSLLRSLVAGARVLCPGRLSEEAVSAVASSVFPAAAREFLQACATASGGNPFYLHEILETARADGVPPTAGGAAEIAGLVPASVLHSVLLRLGRVPDAGPALAGAVAVLGDGTPLSRAAALASLDEERAERAADALARAHILLPGEPLRFTHPLIRAAISDDQPALARSRAHRKAAALLAAEGAPGDVVATHLLACRPAGDPAAAGVLGQAGEHAAARGDYETARRFLTRALAEAPPAQRAGLRLRLTVVEAAVGVPGSLARLIDARDLAEDDVRRGQVLHQLSRLHFARGDFPAAAEAIRAALAHLGADHPLAHRLRTGQLAIGAIQPEACPEAATLLAAAADEARNGRLPGEATLLAQLAGAALYAGAPAREVRELACAAIERVTDDAFYGIVSGMAALALIFVDEPGLAEPAVDAATCRARQAGSLIGAAFASHWRAELCYHRGQLDRAAAAAGDTLDVCRAGWDVCLPMIGTLLARVHTDRGDYDAAEQALRLCAGTAREDLQRAQMLEARGRLALARGETTRALADLEAAGAAAGGGGAAVPPTLLAWRSAAALAAAQLGQRDHAVTLAGAELDRARRIGARHTLGAALRAAGLVTGGRPGIALLAEAADVLERSSAVLEHARALADLGAACRRAGQLAAARDVLRRAARSAEETGAAPLAARAREELRAAGGRRRASRPDSGPAALTAAELRVARLAADGHGTPGIARALHLSRKTVEWHLDHVYRKLGIRSRHQLSAALGQ